MSDAQIELPSFWRRLPVWARALIMGGAVAGAATVPWSVLVSLNLQRDAAVPWSVAAMAIYLPLYWWFVSGGLWLRSTGPRRRALLRIEPLSARGWSWALVALVLGFLAALVFLLGIYARVVDIPAEAFPATGNTPWYVALAYISMVGVVAGVAEEAGYRGYMQSELERAYGPTVAIGFTSAVFALAHLSLTLAPFIALVSILLGVVAYLSRSIVPGVFVHGGYDFLMTTLAWRFGYPRVPSLDLAAGVDDAFIAACALAALATTASVWAMTKLARERV